MNNLVGRLAREEDGQDLVEYALLLGFVAIICIATVRGAGQEISRYIWGVMNGELQSIAGS